MTISFSGSWDSDPSTGGWQSRQTVAADRLQVVTTPKPADQRSAVRCIVNDGDVLFGGERSEVLAIQDGAGAQIFETATSGTQYYGCAYWLPAGWNGISTTGDANAWSIILQLHGPDVLGQSPAFALYAGARTLGGPQNYFISVYGGDVLTGPGFATNYNFTTRGAIVTDQWTQFIIEIIYSSSTTGYVEVWRRDEADASFTSVLQVPSVATLQFSTGNPVGNHYWKQGYYRGPSSAGTSLFYFGPFVRGTDFNEVATAAFAGTPPIPGAQKWDAAHTNVANLLSNNYLTATHSGSSALSATFGVNSNTTGKSYWEVVMSCVAANDECSAGIGNISSSTADGAYLGSATNTIGWFPNSGQVFNNGGSVNTWAPWANGARLCFARDLTSATKKIWGRVGNGNWNNDVIGNQNPATGTGGLIIPAGVLAAAVVPGVQFNSATTPDRAVASFATASWAFSPPAGFGTDDLQLIRRSFTRHRR